MEALPSTWIAIKGINRSDFGCKCSIHEHCGIIVEVDMVLRLKQVRFKENDSWTTIIGAFVVSGGLDDCQVGYLPEGYSVDDKRLHGRLVQVIEIIGDSSAPHKKALSNEHGGLCHGIIIDKVDSDDNSIDQIIDGYNTDGSIDLDD